MVVGLAISLVVLVVAGVGCFLIRDDLDMAPFALILLAAGAFVMAGTFALMLTTRHYDRISCVRYGAQTGRPVRFSNLSAFSWDCFTRDNHGRWIPRDQLRSLK